MSWKNKNADGSDQTQDQANADDAAKQGAKPGAASPSPKTAGLGQPTHELTDTAKKTLEGGDQAQQQKPINLPPDPNEQQVNPLTGQPMTQDKK